jgi:asparagine synthase (glutamine-hydrolysing)
MCGIVGITSAAGRIESDTVTRMRDTLRHRGPDDEGLWSAPDHSVVLGHRRLSIIDLSPGGHQPMSNGSGDCQIVFNGEIYNYREIRDELCRLGHRFHSASDTEVLLESYAEWGTGCLEHLNGMFAFALYDGATRRLFAARDRAGEKPFFYRHANGRFAFASELKALLADPDCPRTLDVSALEFYLAFGYVPFDRCILSGLHKLPQGHALTYDLETDTLQTWAYWTLPEPTCEAIGDTNLLVDELERLLLDSVRMRLIADVPVGVMLSGGIDSSLVTAMAARVSSRRVKTFTISFPGHGEYDEAPFARAVAAHFGTDHVELVAQPATVDLLPQLARQYDEPMADSSMVPTFLVAQLIRREATVALGGDGGDELFGGYPHYSWVQTQATARTLLPRVLRRALWKPAQHLIPVGLKGRNLLLSVLADAPFGLAQFNILFDGVARRRLLAPVRGSNDHLPEQFKADLSRRGQTILQQATAMDFQSYLVDDILVKVDRASMLCSLEVRAPWLDPRLIEMAFQRVPDTLRATSQDKKILPKLLARRVLPPSLDLNRKQGFSMPLHTWFKGDWGTYMRQVLAAADPALFDASAIRALIAGQQRGFSNVQRLFALTVFELWRREYRVSDVARR